MATVEVPIHPSTLEASSKAQVDAAALAFAQQADGFGNLCQAIADDLHVLLIFVYFLIFLFVILLSLDRT